MAILNLDALLKSSLATEPFEFVVTRGLLNADARGDLDRDFPRMDQPGLFPVSELAYGPSFAELLSELQGPGLTAAMSEKFAMDLRPLPTIVTVRGRCRLRDGKIHTDATWKVVSALLYLNAEWESDGGRLRLLRSENLDDVITEIPPDWGTYLAFRRGERSFHGHKPFEGQRRMIQVNWCTGQDEIDREIARHQRSARVKRFFSFTPAGDY
jgi:SM-20-related protein